MISVFRKQFHFRKSAKTSSAPPLQSHLPPHSAIPLPANRGLSVDFCPAYSLLHRVCFLKFCRAGKDFPPPGDRKSVTQVWGKVNLFSGKPHSPVRTPKYRSRRSSHRMSPAPANPHYLIFLRIPQITAAPAAEKISSHNTAVFDGSPLFTASASFFSSCPDCWLSFRFCPSCPVIGSSSPV